MLELIINPPRFYPRSESNVTYAKLTHGSTCFSIRGLVTSYLIAHEYIALAKKRDMLIS